jgi:hypothetical protein
MHEIYDNLVVLQVGACCMSKLHLNLSLLLTCFFLICCCFMQPWDNALDQLIEKLEATALPSQIAEASQSSPNSTPRQVFVSSGSFPDSCCTSGTALQTNVFVEVTPKFEDDDTLSAGYDNIRSDSSNLQSSLRCFAIIS